MTYITAILVLVGVVVGLLAGVLIAWLAFKMGFGAAYASRGEEAPLLTLGEREPAEFALLDRQEKKQKKTNDDDED